MDESSTLYLQFCLGVQFGSFCLFELTFHPVLVHNALCFDFHAIKRRQSSSRLLICFLYVLGTSYIFSKFNGQLLIFNKLFHTMSIFTLDNTKLTLDICLRCQNSSFEKPNHKLNLYVKCIQVFFIFINLRPSY